jgi:hypothetical protein
MKASEKKLETNRVQLYFGEDEKELLRVIKKQAFKENRSLSGQIISDLLKAYPIHRELFPKK